MHTKNLSSSIALHNGDFSGDVKFKRVVDGKFTDEMELPNEDLLEFVGMQMKMRAISDLEQTDNYNIDDISVIEQMTGVEFLELCADKYASIVKLSYKINE